MKKIISLLLVLVFMFSLTACGEKKEKNEGEIDLEYYANLGEMPECEYKLGADADEVHDALYDYAQNADSEELMFNEYEKDGVSGVEDGIFSYFYEDDKKSDGIAYIVSYNKAYNFDLGEVILNIKEKVGNLECSEEELNEENAFFLYGIPEGTALKYEFKENTIMFFFQENELFATAIYRNDFKTK